MKKLLLIAFILSLALVSCESDATDVNDPSTTIFNGYDNTELDQDLSSSDAATKTFSFTATEAWSVSTEDVTKSSSWITVDPMYGDAGDCVISIKIDANESEESRSTTITIAGESGGTPITITITQGGVDNSDEDEENEEYSISLVGAWYTYIKSSWSYDVTMTFFDNGYFRREDTLGDGHVSNGTYEYDEKNQLLVLTYTGGSGTESGTVMYDVNFMSAFEVELSKGSTSSQIYEKQNGEYYLSDFNELSYPKDSYTWTILNTKATASEYIGLSDAIATLGAMSKKVNLFFPNLTLVENKSFQNVSALQSISIPNVVSIGEGAFNSCKDLISLTINDDYFSFDNGVLYNSDFTKIHSYLCSNTSTSYTAPESIVFISDYAFYECDNLTDIILANAKNIGEKTFYDCDMIKNISVATGAGIVLSSIESDAFYNTETSDITLRIGESNLNKISNNNNITIGDFNERFYKIIITDGNGNEYNADGTLSFDAYSPSDCIIEVTSGLGSLGVIYIGFEYNTLGEAFEYKLFEADGINELENDDFAITASRGTFSNDIIVSAMVANDYTYEHSLEFKVYIQSNNMYFMSDIITIQQDRYRYGLTNTDIEPGTGF